MINAGQKIDEILPQSGEIQRVGKVEERGLDVVEHGAQAVGAAAGKQGFHAALVDIQAGSQAADHAFGIRQPRQFLRFV